MNKNKGITLVSLVITIIVMLILVGVSITVAINGGLFNTAQNAAQRTEQAKAEEQVQMMLVNYRAQEIQTGTDDLEQYLEDNFETVTNNGDNTYTVTINGQQVVINKDTKSIVRDTQQEGGENPENPPLPTDPRANISVRYDNNGTSGADTDDIYWIDGILEGYTAQYKITTANDRQENVGETMWKDWTTYNATSGVTFNSNAPFTPGGDAFSYNRGAVSMYIKLIDGELNEYEIAESFSLTNFCFAKDTLVLTANGLKEIQNLKIGDIVISYNEATKQIEEKPIIATHHNKVNYDTVIISTGEQTIECTKGHNIYTVNKGWIEAQNITKEDILLDSKGNNVKITNIKVKTNDYIDVYNLTIKDNHNYFVGEDVILTHNVASGVYCNEAAI